MFSKFDEEAQKVMVEAKREMQALKHPYVGSEHLMLAILKGNNDVSKKLKTFGIDYKKFKNEIINIIGEGSTESDWFLYTPLLKRTLESAVNDAKEVDGVVTISNLFYSITSIYYSLLSFNLKSMSINPASSSIWSAILFPSGVPPS